MSLPNFVVIGAAKAGTTSIYHYLTEHPDIYMCPIKGPNYFAYEGRPSDSFPVGTLGEYEALFDAVAGQSAIGDVSEACFGSPVAAQRMHDLVPDARVVAVLRNPIARAFSGYLMQIRHGNERREMADAFARGAVYVEGGFYHDQLKRYFDLFPREQLRIYLFDDFEADPVALLQDLFGFLQVDQTVTPDVSVRHNTASVPRNQALNSLLRRPAVRRVLKPLVPRSARRLLLGRLSSTDVPELPSEIHSQLASLYREDIERVQELTQLDLSGWTR